MDGQLKEDAYICDHLEKFELATLSSHVDVEIFVFFLAMLISQSFLQSPKKLLRDFFMDTF